MSTRVALIHATKLAIQPIEDAFIQLWPAAERMNLLEDSLSVDLARSGELTPELTRRFVALAQYAKEAGAAGILFTCSAFGPAIEVAGTAVGIPSLKPNEAMFIEALECGRKIGLMTTFGPAAVSMQAELLELAVARNKSIEVRSVCRPEAIAALQAGDMAAHDRLVVEAACSLNDCDVVMLGQFSMARACAAVQECMAIPVLTSPDCAVRMLQAMIERGNASKLI